jgi:hypothetical protein
MASGGALVSKVALPVPDKIVTVAPDATTPVVAALEPATVARLTTATAPDGKAMMAVGALTTTGALGASKRVELVATEARTLPLASVVWVLKALLAKLPPASVSPLLERVVVTVTRPALSVERVVVALRDRLASPPEATAALPVPRAAEFPALQARPTARGTKSMRRMVAFRRVDDLPDERRQAAFVPPRDAGVPASVAGTLPNER